jgi:uncharacterized protein involved in exopolysaccharide biosynthesis
MEELNTGRTEFRSVDIIRFAWKWKWILVSLPLLAALLAAIFSGPSFITPMYRSQVILFPASTNSLSKAMLSQSGGGAKADIMAFGEEEETEQLLQILNSSDIRSRVVEKYDLMNHYEIKPGDKYRITQLYRKYNENIKARRTEFMAVEITVMDKDKDLAASIANHVAALLDSTKIRMTRERTWEAYMVVQGAYFKLRDEIQAMEDSLTTLRKLGVHDYETQSEMINQQLAIELARNNQAGVQRLRAELDLLARYGGAYVSLRDALEFEKKQLSEVKAKFEEAKVDAESVIPQTFIVDRAYPAEKKSYPVRWLIVVVSALSTFLLTLLALIVFDNIRKNKNLIIAE